MAYVKLTDGIPVYYSLGLLRREHQELQQVESFTEGELAAYNVYPAIVDPEPDYDHKMQTAEQQYDYIDDAWRITWLVQDKPMSERQAIVKERIRLDRQAREETAISWTDVKGDTFLFDTSVESQQRHSGAVASINAKMRTDGIWKCADAQGNTVFRVTTNNELISISQLVHEHVQTCFEAEAAASAKGDNEDLTATFEAEYNNLTG